MKTRTRLVATLLALAVAAQASAATTIPADLQARAGALRSQARPDVLSWVDEQGRLLARSSGPPEVRALSDGIRSRFGTRTAAEPGAGVSYQNLGSLADGDIMAIAFLVLMAASKSAQEDLKAIMDGVKTINKEKEALRQTQNERNKASAALRATATPPPDRVAQLVTVARGLAEKSIGANLARIAPRSLVQSLSPGASVVSPRDPASGQATGKRQHVPITLAPEPPQTSSPPAR